MKVNGPYILIKDFKEEYDFFEAILLFVDINDLSYHFSGLSARRFSEIRVENVKKYIKNEYSKKINIFKYLENPKPGEVYHSTYHIKSDEKWVTLEKENNITLDDFFEYAIEKCNQVDLKRDLKINMLEKNYLELYKYLKNGSVKTEL